MRGGPLLPVLVLPAALLAGPTGCGGEHEFDPPDEERRVAEAESRLTATAFDTVSWESDSLRLYHGNELYAAECRQCHGYLGRGDTPYAREHDLEVPSLVERDWAFVDRPDSLRRIVYTGHTGGMPSWGVWRLSPRDIDAVSHYLLHQLRPEVLGDTAR